VGDKKPFRSIQGLYDELRDTFSLPAEKISKCGVLVKAKFEIFKILPPC